MTDKFTPGVALVIMHPIADWDTWKAAFDAHEPARREAGFLGHHINRGADDPNALSVYSAVSDVEEAKAFLGDPQLASAMKDAGVTGPPRFMWLTTLRQDLVWDDDVPGMIVAHPVADFDRWLEGYDAASDLQKAAGIIGHAANRSLDDPSVAVVYHQAKSLDTLRAFVADPDLKAKMEAAGVSGPPDISFHIGGWAKTY